MGRRLALIIGNSIFRDPSLARLLTPDADVGSLADVLLDKEIGGFDDVKLLVNMAAATLRRSISHFFSNKTRDDLLMLYFSGHGVLDENGRLYLATKETERDYLRGTAIPAAFINDEMDNSRSRRQVLILDCCHSGAFARGSKGTTGASVGTATAFEGKGYGRVVLTASDATQYAWEGDKVIGEAENSVFTHYLIEGMQTGKADSDGDGEITVDELYDYAYAQVVNQTPKQTPGKWSYREQGEIVIARALSGPASQPVEVELPEFDDEIESKLKRLYDTGLAAYWLEEWERAAQAFQAIVEARPDYPGVAEKLQEARRQAELAELYKKATTALESEAWERAAVALEAVIAQAPDYREAASQLAFVKQRRQLAELYQQARSLVSAEKWQAAGRVLSKIQESTTDYPDPDGLKALVEENIARLERQRKVESLYSQALREIDSGAFKKARDSLSQLQEMQPGYGESERLLARVEDEIARQNEDRRRQEQVNALYREAQSLARAGQWPKALSKMEELRRLSPGFEDPEDLFTSAQHQVELAERESRRQEKLAALYAEAVRLFETGDYQKAVEKIAAIREIDPHYVDREEIQRRAQEKLAAPAKKISAWRRKPLAYLRAHIWLAAGAVVLVGLLVWGGFKANQIFSGYRGVSLAPIGGQVSVMVAWDEAGVEDFQAMLAPFTKETGVSVNIEVSPQDPDIVLQSRVKSGNPPDLAVIHWPYLWRQFIQEGSLVPLDDILDMDRLQEQYDSGYLQIASLNGSLYGTFIRTDVKSLVWYNPQAFEAAGYSIPENWEQLQALEEQIIADGAAPWCIGLESGPASGWPGTDWIEDIMLRTADLQTYDDWVHQELPWIDEAVRNAWIIWGDIVRDPNMVYGGSTGMLTTNFAQSPLPMFDDPPGCYLDHQAGFVPNLDSVAGKEINFFPMPPIDDEHGSPLLVTGDLIGMFNDTPQSRALMQWLVSSEAQTIWAQRGGYLSPNKQVSPKAYPDRLKQKQAQLLASSSAVRYDASDLMPQEVNSEFFRAVQDYVENPNNFAGILGRIEWTRKAAK
jgi:alpha-glucoside transport system substrate-binding protein